jgi:hypothetical protein
MLGTGAAGALLANLAVQQQGYDHEGFFTPQTTEYSGPFLFFGVILGLLIGNAFSRMQGSWIVWFLSWGLTIGAAWAAPRVLGVGPPLNMSTKVAWIGVAVFLLVHTIALTMQREPHPSEPPVDVTSEQDETDRPPGDPPRA